MTGSAVWKEKVRKGSQKLCHALHSTKYLGRGNQGERLQTAWSNSNPCGQRVTWMTHVSLGPFLIQAHLPYVPLLKIGPFRGLLTTNRIPNTFRKYPNGGRINRSMTSELNSLQSRFHPGPNVGGRWAPSRREKRSAPTRAPLHPGRSRRHHLKGSERRLQRRPRGRPRKASKTTCPWARALD